MQRRKLFSEPTKSPCSRCTFAKLRWPKYEFGSSSTACLYSRAALDRSPSSWTALCPASNDNSTFFSDVCLSESSFLCETVSFCVSIGVPTCFSFECWRCDSIGMEAKAVSFHAGSPKSGSLQKAGSLEFLVKSSGVLPRVAALKI